MFSANLTAEYKGIGEEFLQEDLPIRKRSDKDVEKMNYEGVLIGQSKELIGKNKELTKELKAIKQNIASLANTQSRSHIESTGALIQQIEIAKETIERLTNENDSLRQALRTEQGIRTARKNEVVTLEEKLKRIEKEMKRCEDTRYNLSVDIQTLQSNIQRLTQKLNQSEQLCQSYVGLFKRAGLLMNSK